MIFSIHLFTDSLVQHRLEEGSLCPLELGIVMNRTVPAFTGGEVKFYSLLLAKTLIKLIQQMFIECVPCVWHCSKP